LDKLLADFFFKSLLIRSASDKKSASECLLVGSLLSKSSDFAGEITIFIFQILSKNNQIFVKISGRGRRVLYAARAEARSYSLCLA
jgi:hypothetical protein